jgi:hypothetical protein
VHMPPPLISCGAGTCPAHQVMKGPRKTVHARTHIRRCARRKSGAAPETSRFRLLFSFFRAWIYVCVEHDTSRRLFMYGLICRGECAVLVPRLKKRWLFTHVCCWLNVQFCAALEQITRCCFGKQLSQLDLLKLLVPDVSYDII